jgi:hypothetical protein
MLRSLNMAGMQMSLPALVLASIVAVCLAW